MKLFLVFSSIFCLALAQTPPVIPEAFLARFKLEYKAPTMTADGEGTWARSEDVNAEEQELEMRVRMADNTTHLVRSTNLTLYSGQPEEYYVLEVDGKKEPCLEAMLAWPHELPHIWDWLKVANNTGSDKIDGHEVQIWNYTATGVSIAGYIERDDTPYILKYMIGGNFTQFTFLDFRLEKPHDTHSFRIPEECESGNDIAQGSPGFFTDLFRFKFWN